MKIFVRNFVVPLAVMLAWSVGAGVAPAVEAAARADDDAAAEDDRRAAAAGLRKLVGRHLTVYTDLPSTPAVDELPQVFDAAVPQWSAYFDLREKMPAAWRMRAFLMQDRERFRAAGLIPDVLPEFQSGFSIGDRLWMLEQPSDYYRRHLLLHEGTHGVMNTLLGGCGAPWFMEGTAELLATHRWAEGKLELATVPTAKEEVPRLGRVEYVREDVEVGRLRTVDDLVNDAVRGYVDTPSYAWCWAFALFLDRHPAYRDRFHALERQVANARFNDAFRRLYADDLPTLRRQWLIFAGELDYGTDVERSVVEFRPGKPLDSGGEKITVAADRGWQASGLRLEAGRTYRVQAAGRYQIAVSADPSGGAILLKPWPCEPDGVTIRYYRGRPLGVLLAAVEPDEPAPGVPSALLSPTAIGSHGTIHPAETGTLYFRVNDSIGEFGDNAGTIAVEVIEER